ncbi:Hypothetical predicted protein [Octopus vulgaris]|uniref:Uncharacterized protein n=2 Tax=Octopus TaxID=6643 RepID=A0AA36BHK8_OCTVU|nr:terminal nucleotidyltransferase 5C [Octopus sinensis]XP_036365885.1 terminal nucleotidyltransferase 5C [Octopus sinensis]CAI9734203.1 Hypothetical predicted protein [Octopus vulgaris]
MATDSVCAVAISSGSSATSASVAPADTAVCCTTNTNTTAAVDKDTDDTQTTPETPSPTADLDAVTVVTVEPVADVDIEEEEAGDELQIETYDEEDCNNDGSSLSDQMFVFGSTELLDDTQSSCRFKVLEYDQLMRLVEVMEASIPIHGRGNFPTLDVKLKDLIQLVRQKLKSEGVHVRDMRLNGGAASYVLETDTSQTYNDLDLIFGIDLSNQNELQKVKNCVLGCLLDFLPAGVSKDRMSSCSLKEAYVQKMVKVCNEHGDRWSLISLSNNKGKNVELKFVDKMKRQFEFSVDSFQIILDSLLTFYEVSNTPTSEHFYPTVKAESVYGDFSQAWFHLTEKLIATRNPEEIRGGGLLKYCNLLVRRYTPAGNVDIRAMERYMCSRFFIDFSDLSQQKQKLDAYLANHFSGEEDLKYEYLMTLYRVVDDSTICLMGHERRQTLNLIHQLACEILLEQEQKAQSKYLQLPQFDNLNNLILDQVFYGPYNNSSGGSQYYSYLPFYQVGNSSISSCPLCPQPYLQCS